MAEEQKELPRSNPMHKLVLDDEKQKTLDDLKVKTRHSDAMYLRQHPELSLLINRFMWAVFEDNPDDPLTFAQDFFTQKNLETHILGIDAEGESSDGEEDNLVDLFKERAQKRRTVKQMLQTKRKQRIRREKRAKAEKPCIDLDIDSSTDDDVDDNFGQNYGLSEERVEKLKALFVYLDQGGKGAVDTYELRGFAKGFFSAIDDTQLKLDAELMLEEIDVECNGQINQHSYIDFFSLISGDMEQPAFDRVCADLMDILQGVVTPQENPNAIGGERMVKLKMLFQGWDPKNSGQVPRDIVYLIAQACQSNGVNIDPAQINSTVEDSVSRDAFFDVCARMQMKGLDDATFSGIVDPLLEQRYG